MTANILAAARSAGARLVFPGNVYGYGPPQRIPATEDHPLAATTRKGRLRNALERTLWDAHERGEVAVVIPRFPDFYGPNVWNTPGYLVFARVTAGKRPAGPAALTFCTTSSPSTMPPQPRSCSAAARTPPARPGTFPGLSR